MTSSDPATSSGDPMLRDGNGRIAGALSQLGVEVGTSADNTCQSNWGCCTLESPAGHGVPAAAGVARPLTLLDTPSACC